MAWAAAALSLAVAGMLAAKGVGDLPHSVTTGPIPTIGVDCPAREVSEPWLKNPGGLGAAPPHAAIFWLPSGYCLRFHRAGRILFLMKQEDEAELSVCKEAHVRINGSASVVALNRHRPIEGDCVKHDKMRKTYTGSARE